MYVIWWLPNHYNINIPQEYEIAIPKSNALKNELDVAHPLENALSLNVLLKHISIISPSYL
jgi:hypothetical protein